MVIPAQPFGFVAGRWVLSLADTPLDADRAPDYKPLFPGSVIFNNKLSHRVVITPSETVGIVKTRIEAKLNEDGKLTDAEEHEFIALPVGVYSVTFSFGQYSWPNFDIEVKSEHTIDSPLWLPSHSPMPAGPGVVHVVSEEVRLAAEAAAASAWEAVDTPGRQGPQGIPGPPGDLDTEHLAGTPRLTNRAHNQEWTVERNAVIDSQADGVVKFTATALGGFIRAWGNTMVGGAVYYFAGEVKATSDRVIFGTTTAPAYHSGSGHWERLSGRVAPSSNIYFMVNDPRPSGWDPIEVRNSVLIDLTAVFGAGREPTKEYMDELLAKHGNYIGGVAPFAVGDALQALTVAGPGMTIRQDNSVGTRVLLERPGRTTIMLYGDTGWRDVSGDLLNGWTGALHIRRENRDVILRANALNGSAATSDLAYTLPQGMVDGVWRNVHVYDSLTGKILDLRFYPNELRLPLRPEVYFSSGYVEFQVARNNSGSLWPTTNHGTAL